MPLSSTQEKQLLALVADGLSNPEVARTIRLNVDRGRAGWGTWSPTITGSAVANFLTVTMGKLGAVNRVQAVHLAYCAGILTIEGTQVDVMHPDGKHDYHSTHCRHGNHELCKGKCKGCGSPCRCRECHGGGNGGI